MLSKEELKHCRNLYKAEVDFVDKQIGQVLDKIDDCGLFESSLIFLLADHGLPIGEHGKIQKTRDNLYSELLNIPFIMWHPEIGNKKFKQLVQPKDLVPTVLDSIGIGKPQNMHGKSLLSLKERN